MVKIDLTASQVAKVVSGNLVGDPEIKLTNLTEPHLAGETSLCLVSSKPKLMELKDKKIGLLILSEKFGDLVSGPRVVVADLKLAMTKLLTHLFPRPKPRPGVHPSASVAQSAEIADDVEIMAGAVIGERTRIAKGTIIHPNVVIGDDSSIGESCILYPSAIVYHECEIKDRVILHSGVVIGADGYGYTQGPRGHIKVPQVGNVVIEDDVEIGANSTIDRATLGSTRIGSGTKIDNLVMIGHNCVIGRNCLFCGDVGMAGSVTVGDGVVFAGKAGIADHLTIGSGAVVGPCAAVGKDIAPGEQVVGGSKAMPASKFWRSHFYYERLPELVKRIRKLESERSSKPLSVSGEKGLDRPQGDSL
ncbi:UDP-3-O-(3-hydroxymyristoyl)glucosamine N-acyltransferase [Bdellovibrionota bacterium]